MTIFWYGTQLDFMIAYGWLMLSVAILPGLIAKLIQMLRKNKK